MFNPAYNVLLIDDDMDILDSYQDLLRQEGYQVITCADPIDIVAQIPENWIGIILCDVLLPNISGLKILEDIIQRDAQIPVIMITSHGDVPMAVEAVKKGATNFLEKPISAENLLIQVAQALEKRAALMENRQWQLEKLSESFIGQSEWIIAMRHQLQKLADIDVPLFLWGETGTGRYLSATYLHKLSARQNAPFIYHECLPQAQCNLDKCLDDVQQGTLVLKNIHHLAQTEQQHLAKALNMEGCAFRLILISDFALLTLIQEQRICSELYYLFLHTQFELLPLKKRPSDILPIFCHYVHKSCARLNKEYVEPNKKLIQHLLTQTWQGNVKELIHVAELYAIGLLAEQTPMSNPLALKTEHIKPLDEQINEYEKQIIEDALIFYQGRINDVATYLNIPRKKLYLRMKKHHIDKKHYKC
ncbi:TPA: sigma-54-dependent Fis family transcriptional regulator [Pasteurella multocida]|uniref:sigma-54-dependent transcriptional regulator n=1 Tax=Pasteurella multocida TaxID=747 RepID=UPI0028DEE466|nr:sigma-54 dependent transcriptional regulator [Pasteurella multocida]MDY0498736.1 sigma-54 dependent transcriptional regulator [Pasteurella multocida]WRU39810.1 sigma-54 dependent transcriptional regulator [Pasteurella multocida]HDR1921072.1 sigma-54-dependent Fis family transcriptional regulator [Pasteurella multocida]HEA3245555.1 sigma-54-dependent Fis family transcriptional regulator [Pasteurella multocida]HEH9649105.1 sigma-54-dependent Fis family transcriptional regulator [Pasteurella m